MKPYLYTLDEKGEPVGETDVLAWAKWLSTIDRNLADTILVDGTRISTIFTGIDFAHLTGRKPALYETSVFGGPRNHDRRLYTTRSEAMEGHDKMVQLCIRAMNDPEAEK